MGLYIGFGIVLVGVVGWLCNHFYYKGYRDCFEDQKRNKEFGKNFDSLKCYVIGDTKKGHSFNSVESYQEYKNDN